MLSSSNSNKNSKKFLLIFDFDQTIVDKDSEEDLLRMTFSKNQYDEIITKINTLDFFDGFNYYFKLMKNIGITIKVLNETLSKLQLSPGMEELLKYVQTNKSKFEVVILSSCIDYWIKQVLNHYGFSNLVDEYLCTKAIIEEKKSDLLLYVPKNQFPHNCSECSKSQCKSAEFEKYFQKKKFEKILFVCDGSNDFCPSEKIMNKGDILFPRDGYKLMSKLKKTNFSEIICEVHPWKNASEIILELNKLIK